MDDIGNHSKFEPESQDKIVCGEKVRYFHFQLIDSTNTWAKEHPDNWEENGLTVITAHQQTGGRGRFNRKWESPAGVNIYATFCFFVPKDWFQVGQVPLIQAISAAQVMEEYGFSPKIKWPNDLMLEGKKVGGILCETIEHKNGRGVICGIGLNINMTQETADKIDQPATSLLLVGGKKLNVKKVTEKLVERFVINRQHGFNNLYDFYVAHSYFQSGDKLILQDGNRLVEGTFAGYDSGGAIMICRKDGLTKSYFSGEIIKHDK